MGWAMPTSDWTSKTSEFEHVLISQHYYGQMSALFTYRTLTDISVASSFVHVRYVVSIRCSLCTCMHCCISCIQYQDIIGFVHCGRMYQGTTLKISVPWATWLNFSHYMLTTTDSLQLNWKRYNIRSPTPTHTHTHAHTHTQLQYLQVASFANNKLTSTGGFTQPMLDRLNLSCKCTY